jgi:hypothetical protein
VRGVRQNLRHLRRQMRKHGAHCPLYYQECARLAVVAVGHRQEQARRLT